MNKVLLRLALAFSLSFSFSFASKENTGCGLGEVLLGETNSLFGQLVVVASNGTSGNQTFGISSGTSGCQKYESLVYNEDTYIFVSNNLDSLAKDIAMGGGESLYTLALYLNQSDKESFSLKLKDNFSSIFTKEDISSKEFLENISKII